MARRGLYNVPHDVYRIYDAAGVLLYVGCTVNTPRRIKQHKAEHQPWFPAAATVDVEEYHNYRTARLVEATAIKEEAPAWNVAKEAMALVAGRGTRPVPTETYDGILIGDFWGSA